MEDKEDAVILIDEDGQETEFEYLDTIEMDGKEYVVLLPADDNSDEEQDSDEVVILRIEHGPEGEDSFISVEDDKELDEVFEEFKARMEEEYEFD